MTEENNTSTPTPEQDAPSGVHRSEIIADLLEIQPVTDQKQDSNDDSNDDLHFYFAGGGTGGHIYPAIAVAQQIVKLSPNAKLTFFCSNRGIDSHILNEASFDYITLPARGLSLHPARLASFVSAYAKSRKQAYSVMSIAPRRSVLISVGGFVSAGPVLAARKLGIPVIMINVDFVPGKANKHLAKYAKEVFVQFPETKKQFSGRIQKKVSVSGCPLRDNFESANPDNVINELQLDKNKKTLLIIGGSSGAQSVNNAISLLFPAIASFASSWQIVHVTGRSNYQQVKAVYTNSTLEYKVVDYYHNMSDLYACADLLIGRAGGVSVAEYATSGLPSICLPYPYHKDNHQYLNAKPLADAGACIIVEDTPKDCVATSRKLVDAVVPLMKDDQKRKQMAEAAAKLAPLAPARQIAQSAIEMIGS